MSCARPESELQAEVARLRARVVELERSASDHDALLADLKKSEERYRKLVEQASDAIVVADVRGRIQSVNPAGLELLGYSEQEILRLGMFDLVHPEDLAHNPPDIEGVRARRTVLNRRRLIRRDGSTIPTETSTRLLDDGSMQLIVRDIRGRLRREEELRRESTHLELLKDVAVAANQCSEPDQAFRTCLELVCEATGWALGHVYRRAPGTAPLLVSSGIWYPSGAARHTAFRETTARTRFAPEEAMPGRVLATRRPEWLRELRTVPGFVRREPAVVEGLESAAAFPVFAGREVMAVLEFFSETQRQPEPGLLDVMVHLGTQLGNAWERWSSTRAVREMTDRMNLALRSARVGTWSWDIRQNRIGWDDYFLRLFGIDRGPSPARLGDFLSLIHPDDRARMQQKIRGAMRSAGTFDAEFRAVWPDGTVRVLVSRGEFFEDAEGRLERGTGVCWDVTERWEADEQIRRLAFFDPLTGLPNRTLFQDHLAGALERAQQAERRVALLFLDLDNFKDVNDSLGHSAGDALLRQVCERLLSRVRLRDLLARPGRAEEPGALSRLGGDEFTLLLSDVSEIDDVAKVAARVIEALSEPFEISGKEIFAQVSIGIALFPDDGEDAQTLIRNADAAMYHAKSQERGGYAFYTRSLNEAAARRRELDGILRRALEGKGLSLRYQPIVDAGSAKVVGAETLLRLEGEGSAIPPSEFIPAAEESGLIVPIGEWVLRNACAQCRRWRNEGLGALRVAVNVSAHQVRRPGFAEGLADLLRQAKLPPDRVVLELTESVIMRDDATTTGALRALHEMGVLLALDDFGTGYSSLSYLRRFPLHRVKIDRSFVSEVTTRASDAALTGGIIRMARSLGLRIVAEGVETRAQVEFLLAQGCDELQGFLFSPPLGAEEFVAFARRQGVLEATTLSHEM